MSPCLVAGVNTDEICKGNDGETQNTAHKDMSSIYQDQRVQPCHLSSSIYYGGQDIYYYPQSTQNEGLSSLVSGSAFIKFIFSLL